jgi:hypothetical protein
MQTTYIAAKDLQCPSAIAVGTPCHTSGQVPATVHWGAERVREATSLHTGGRCMVHHLHVLPGTTSIATVCSWRGQGALEARAPCAWKHMRRRHLCASYTAAPLPGSSRSHQRRAGASAPHALPCSTVTTRGHAKHDQPTGAPSRTPTL